MQNLQSLIGLLILIGLAYLLSSNRKQINWNIVKWGLIFQVIIALFVFVIPIGAKFFLSLNDVVLKIFDCAQTGTRFMFGRLALGPGQVGEFGEKSLGFILAFQSLPTILFFSALISVLYFLRIMQFIIKGFAYVFTKLMKISGAESLVVASNIFVGVESMLTIKPYLKNLTRSELCTILTACMATVASSVLGLYVFTLKDVFPTIATHLISASLLSAPAALIISKMLIPETGEPETLGLHIEPHYEKKNNLFEAIIDGASTGLTMIFGIVALLIAVLGLVALADLILVGFGAKLNSLLNTNIGFSLKEIAGYIFYPFTLIMGIPFQDAGILSQIIGERIIVTEVVSYQDLAKILSTNVLQHPRSAVITTYALCGFAHLASMAIFSGGIVALVPSKSKLIAEVAPKALLAATFACLMTATVAGIFFTGNSLLLGA